jgi:hypothetical protein
MKRKIFGGVVVGAGLPVRYRIYKAVGLVAVSAGAFLAVNAGDVTPALAHNEEEEEVPPAPGSTWEPESCVEDNLCGDLSPLFPMSYNAVGVSVLWPSVDAAMPVIMFKGRHSEFKPTDVYDIDCAEAAILSSHYPSWPIPREEWEHHFPSGVTDPLDIFRDSDDVERFDTTGNSHLTKGFSPCIRSSFKHLVYGGYRLHQGQSLFVANRIRAYWTKENSQIWNLAHPDAFKTREGGVFDNALLDEDDAVLNLASFEDAGASKGLHYSIYSLGYATLHDGRVINVGGHNMQSNSGFRKLNIFDPSTRQWAPRPVPCNIANWRADPGGVALGYKAHADAVALAGGQPGSFGGVTDYVPAGDQLVNPPDDAPTWPNCDQRNREDVDPSHQSDMRYQRWYPSAITLPDGKALVFGGDDLDESVGPDLAIDEVNDRDAAFRATQIATPVMDVYDPATDSTTALENARKVYDLYPQGIIVETGPADDDWAFCTLGGQPAPASEATVPRSDATDDAAEWRNFCETPGCAEDTRAVRLRLIGAEPAASIDCLDVQAALADPNVNEPAENHWTHIDTAKNGYGYCCGEADVIQLGPNGQTLSHKWIHVDGTIARGLPGAGSPTNEIEMIDFADEDPTIRVVAHTYQPGTRVTLLPLPDGNVLIRGGNGPGGGTFELRQYTKLQQFNPDDHTIRILAKSTFLGGIHRTTVLLPTGETLDMGGDRSSMVQEGDRTFSPGDQDLGVSSAQKFQPPYLFADADGTLATRPAIVGSAPNLVTYKQQLRLRVSGRISKVTMFRTGSKTHQLHNDNRLVMLNFRQTGNQLRIDMPWKPAQAIAGDYMLFLVNDAGTPSIGKHVRLQL